MAKSILEIEVKDDSFREFAALFDKYRGQAAKQPAQWEKFTKALGQTAEGMAALLEAVESIAEETKEAENSQNRFTRSVNATGRAVAGVARGTKSIASNLASATKSLLKWASLTTVFSGLLGAGGLFGIDRLAQNVASDRRSAKGLGVTSGAQKAFGLNFGRFVDPDAFLGNIADAQNDWARRWAFSAMGINPRGKDPAKLGGEMLGVAKKMFDRSDQSQQFAQAHGLLEFFSMEDLRRLHNTKASELNASQRGFARDTIGLQLGDTTQKAWTDFNTQLSRAGMQIENVLIKGLTPLVGPLSKLSEALSRALAGILANPNIGTGIENFGKSMEKFSKYVGSTDFQKDIGTFIDDLERLFHFLHKAIGFLTPDSPEKKEADKKALLNYMMGKTGGSGQFSMQEGQYGLPAGLLGKVYQAESSGGKNLRSPKGAVSGFGLMPATIRESGMVLMDPADTEQAANISAWKINQLRKRFKGDMTKAMAAYNWGETALQGDINAHGADWAQHLPKETRDYLNKLDIHVNNNTGGSAIITASQAAR